MKNVVIVLCTLCLFSNISIAQKKSTKNSNNIVVKGKEYMQADIYIDGIKYDHAILELLDQTKIESVSVLKGEEAIKEYNAQNGVILIKSKTNNTDVKANIKGESPKGLAEPMVIIDDEKSNHEELKKLDPYNIKSIDVIKGEKATNEYDAPNGVIIVTTKK